jgi:hypothetical protein
VLVSVTLLVLMLVGTVVAVIQGWPAQFGGGGNRDDVGGEALTRGTALSPPLAPVVAFVVALVLSVRGGIVGVVGTVLLILVSLLFVVGGLGEAFAPPTADVPRGVLALSGLLAVMLGTAVIVAAIGRLREKR